MKSKTVNPKTSTNNSTKLPREESNKKIQMLMDKLASHFKLRLASLIAEKNYKNSNMVVDIGTFLRKLGNNNLETESVIPKLEKHLLEILSKMASDHSKYITELSKINQILKTEVSGNSYVNPLAHSVNNVSNSQNNLGRKINVKGNINLINSNDELLINSFNENNNQYLKSLPNQTSVVKTIASKPGAHLAVNPIISAKGDAAKSKVLNKTNSKKNILNVQHQENKAINKNEKLNDLVTEKATEKIINSNTNNNSNYNNFNTKEHYYSNETLNNNEILHTYATRSNSTPKLHKNPNNYNNLAKEASLNMIQKTEKLNDLKEKAMDEWAMIVKYNHLKHLEEEQNKKNLEEEKKRKVREILENQMKEKDNIKKLKQEEDKKFFKMQTEKIVKMEKDFFEKERLRLEKIKLQKETQEKLIKGILNNLFYL